MTYDAWKARGPHEDMPSVLVPKGRETCEVCRCSVAAVSVARCGDHYSYWPRRPERKVGR